MTDAAIARQHIGIARLTIVLGVVSAASPLAVDMYLPAFDAIGRDLDADIGQVQLTFATFTIAVALMPLIYGPLSDRFGRRVLIMLGMGGFVISSLLCSIADSFEMLLILRAVQGATSSIGVLSQAVVRDVMRGHEALRLMSLMMLIHSVSPLLAPAIGSAVIGVASWRWIFVILAVPGLIAIALILIGLPETLPPQRRRAGGARETVRTYRRIVMSRHFVIPTLIGSAAMAVLHVYVASSSFLLIELYGVDAAGFSLSFAAGAVVMIGSAQGAAPLARRFGTVAVTRAAMILAATMGVILGALASTGLPSLPLMLGGVWTMLVGVGLLLPTSTVLALEHFEADAGAAASMANALRHLIAAAATIIAGLSYNGSAMPMMATIAACGLLGLLCLLCLPRGGAPAGQDEWERAQEGATIV